MLLPTNGCWEFNHIPLPLCLWSNKQTNHEQNTWQHVNCRVLGSKHTSQFSTNQLIVTEFGWAVSKVSSKKILIGLQDSYRFGLFFLACIHACMMNFMCRMCFCVAVHVKGTDSNKSNLVNYWWAISRTIPGNFISTSMLCITFLWLSCCCCFSHKIRIGLDCDNAALVNCLLR